jgi:hypothetical protein
MRRVLITALVVSACAEEESKEVVEIGVVSPSDVRIELPSTARVGEHINVVLRTIGDGCTRHERTDIALGVERADITPYDRRTQTLCDDSAGLIMHDALLSFPSAGEKTIVVHGLEFSPADASGGAVPGNIEVIRTITVE